MLLKTKWDTHLISHEDGDTTFPYSCLDNKRITVTVLWLAISYVFSNLEKNKCESIYTRSRVITVQNQRLNLVHSKLKQFENETDINWKNGWWLRGWFGSNAGKQKKCNSLSTVSQVQVRQGDQPWYPEDTIEGFVENSMGFLCPPAEKNIRTVNHNIKLRLSGTEFDSHTTALWPVLRGIFGFSEWLGNSRGLRSLWLHKAKPTSELNLDFPCLGTSRGKWDGIWIADLQVWGGGSLLMQNLWFAKALGVYRSPYEGWNQQENPTVH